MLVFAPKTTVEAEKYSSMLPAITAITPYTHLFSSRPKKHYKES